jgi:hypothetical protein
VHSQKFQSPPGMVKRATGLNLAELGMQLTPTPIVTPNHASPSYTSLEGLILYFKGVVAEFS